VHIGNFREIISTELVARALKDRGKKVRFIYSWDYYDVFRKVPKNMPKPEELEKVLRYPITMVPDPWDRDESYARHHEVDVETMLPRVGIKPEYLYQTRRYQASTYAGGIRKALEHRDELKAILDKYRDEEHKIQGEWWPISVFCDKCSKDDTDIDGWDGEWGVTYHCNACGRKETVDLRSAKGIKPEYLYQTRRYQASTYAGGIRKALEHRDELKAILDKYRDEEHKIQGEWWPISVFCDKCSKDETDIDSWDGEWGVTYHCNACGHKETVDLRGAKGVKLGWRVDWPMRWEYEKVDFEPAGKDHHSQGGSFDTAKHVCKDVYGWDAPAPSATILSAPKVRRGRCPVHREM
jgi:lysyl-tRNA synthetase class I